MLRLSRLPRMDTSNNLRHVVDEVANRYVLPLARRTLGREGLRLEVHPCRSGPLLVMGTVVDQTLSYLFLGDLNTMGMEYKYLRERDIEADQEILEISGFATGRGMRLLMKDDSATWWGGPNTLIPPSNLDQVVAADHLQFKSSNGVDVTVLGWPKEGSVPAQGEWIKDYFDNGCLYFEVQKVS